MKLFSSSLVRIYQNYNFNTITLLYRFEFQQHHVVNSSENVENRCRLAKTYDSSWRPQKTEAHKLTKGVTDQLTKWDIEQGTFGSSR